MNLEELEKLAAPLRDHVAQGIEFPEPGWRLDMESREGAPDRQFKYLHQMCLLHAENFARAQQIKVSTLIDGYQAVAEAKNPLGPYLFARAIFELGAFTWDVSKRLRDIANKPDSTWRTKGEEYFSLIVRARFATSDPSKQKLLEAGGCPTRLLKPINIMSSVQALLAEPNSESLRGQALRFRAPQPLQSSCIKLGHAGRRLRARCGWWRPPNVAAGAHHPI
jgi:hypothetical protein